MSRSVTTFAVALFFAAALSEAKLLAAEPFPCSPASEFLTPPVGDLDPDFCSRWNPEFGLKGYNCCARKPRPRRGVRCHPSRAKTSYCSEMNDEQMAYSESVASGQIPDVLRFLEDESRRRGQQQKQAFCSVSQGFLAFGRPVVSTSVNRIRIRNPHRCVSFGTDPMVGMLEWVGRKVHTEYQELSAAQVLVGDISAPRGGCLPGRGGRKGHASHTNGQDVDVGFLVANPKARAPASFIKEFDARANWWFIKQLFQNPYACVKVIFLDRKLISKLGRAAGSDPEWPKVSRYIRHIKYHRNHFHVRIGDGPGTPGCQAPLEDDADEDSEGDSSVEA